MDVSCKISCVWNMVCILDIELVKGRDGLFWFIVLGYCLLGGGVMVKGDGRN